MSDETTLLPCPFCGGEAHVVSDYSSEHDETRWNLWHECCEHDGESAGYGHALFPWFETPWYKTEAEAIAAWNTRAPVEYDGWFYLPKPKESIVQYGEQRTQKTEHGYKVTQPVEVIESAIRSWSDELGEYIMKRICEAWSTRAELGSGTCEIDYFDDGLDEALDGEIISYAPPTWYLTCGHTVQGMEAPSFCQECGKRVIEAVER